VRRRSPRSGARAPARRHRADGLAGGAAALGELLRRDAAARGPIVLVIDQLENCSRCARTPRSARGPESIAAAARDAGDPVRVIPHPARRLPCRVEQIAPLRNRIAQALQLLAVPPRRICCASSSARARRRRLRVRRREAAGGDGREVADQPGAARADLVHRVELWDLRDRHFRQLTRKSYKSLGGVGGALAQHAEQTLERMPPEERKLTREAFRHLVTTQNTQRVLEGKELRQLLGGSDHADGVMEKLIAARLLVASENESGSETIEIIHEALLVTWPRLVEWRREDVDGMRCANSSARRRSSGTSATARRACCGAATHSQTSRDGARAAPRRSPTSRPRSPTPAPPTRRARAGSSGSRSRRFLAGLVIGVIVLQRRSRIAEHTPTRRGANSLSASQVDRGAPAPIAITRRRAPVSTASGQRCAAPRRRCAPRSGCALEHDHPMTRPARIVAEREPLEPAGPARRVGGAGVGRTRPRGR